ncbi:MAG: efflux RND transporter permease subunit, partial [Dehalococcoidia bacterium]|nr:efflux RND transporter permease subunit [Dehalococcoidia bacterium]
VLGALATANAAVPGGRVTEGTRQYALEVTGRYADARALEGVIVTGVGGQQVRLADIATVHDAATERKQATRSNGKQAILIAIGQQSGTNLTDVTDSVRQALPLIRATLPQTSNIAVVLDATPFVRNSLTGIQEELAGAVVLTSLILLAFLHNPRAAVIVLLSIPTTLLTTFVAMQMMGFSLNFLSMLGLTLTIGILVDDSIVVIENILRHLARGEKPQTAALMGRAEIGLAAVAITLVDVVVFAPTGLVSGQVGGFFREFGFTIAAATLISLVVSFTLTPMLATYLLRAGDAEVSAEARGFGARFGRWWDGWFGALEERYRAILAWSLVHRVAVASVATASVVAGVSLITTGTVPVEFVPHADSNFFTISTEAPPGTALEAHEAAMRQVDDILAGMPELEVVTSSVGVRSRGAFGSASSGEARFGAVTILTIPSDERRDIFAVMDDARERLAVVSGIKINVSMQSGGPGGNQAPISVRITGAELDTLTRIAAQIEAMLQGIPGVINVSNGAPAGQPQIRVEIDQARAADLGVSAASVGGMVRTAFAGTVATKLQNPDGTQTDVRVLLTQGARLTTSTVGGLPVVTATGRTVPLRQVADITLTDGPTQIARFDRARVVNVGGDLANGETLAGLQPAILKGIEELGLPPGYSAGLAGQSEEQAESFGQLFLALGASIVLAYLLMALLYDSLLHPLVILFALPAAVGGAIFGLLLFGYSFSVFSMIGMILLVGLAIKNGILLVDRTNQNRRAGMEVRAALLEAGPVRLRPILMTSLTIAMALLPTALQLGEGAEFRAPLAATVIGGVVSSTLLTLVLVPVVYTIVDDIPRWITQSLAWVAPRPVSAARVGGGGGGSDKPSPAAAGRAEEAVEGDRRQ